MAKYDNLRKVDPQLVIAYRRTYPDWSLREIAQKLGISRQRVSQILLKVGSQK